MNTTVDERVKDVIDFLTKLKNLKSESGYTAFRGHAYNKWPLKAPIHRSRNGIEQFEHKITRELISIHPQEFYSDQTMFDRLVRMQHYGLPTRLVDVTSNPLVALYFACQPIKIRNNKTQIMKPADGAVLILKSNDDRVKYYDSDTVSVLSNLSNLRHEELLKIVKIGVDKPEELNESFEIKRLINFIKVEKPHFTCSISPKDLYKPIFVKAKNNNRRIIAQSGSFIIFGLKSDSDSDKEIYKKDSTIERIIIPAVYKEDILSELRDLGIHSSALFPELDKAAQSLKDHYKALFDQEYI